MKNSASHQVTSRLKKLGDKAIATHSAGFFKTGPGEYGEGDRFFGIRVPVLRKLIKEYTHLGIEEVEEVLHSRWHEQRLLALLIWVDQFDRGSEATQEAIFRCYLANTQWINSWDLVDSSVTKIVGAWLLSRDRRLLYDWVKSDALWERRMAIVATFRFIRENQFEDTFDISRQLLQDEQDLIHKAVGWMLREVGKQSQLALEQFLRAYYQSMPRTMLRYAIERLPDDLRKSYLQGRI